MNSIERDVALRNPATSPTRVGVILADLGKLNTSALKYLIVHTNTLQSSIEFEILSPIGDYPLLLALKDQALADREECRTMIPDFYARLVEQFERDQDEYGLSDRTLPSNFVVISRARFNDEHFGLKKGQVHVQALGDWERKMAPPSILEFIVILLMRQAASFVVPSLGKSVHLGTKGCLFDFTPNLDEARYKALQSFICSTCRDKMRASGASRLAVDLANVLDLNWLGTTVDPHSPAAIVANLGYNLFLTKGVRPTVWETVRSILRDEATKEIIKLIFAILLAVVVAHWSLKK